jgi:GTP-binding protein
MSAFSRTSFFKSVARLDDLPESEGEIAFAGRSNAGKSSALNTLTGRRLAFVSKTPGRTQLINFYSVGDHSFLTDLPGYGYARVPTAARADWEQLLGGYLQNRDALRGLALIMDVRHPLTELDRRMLAWFMPTGKPVHVLLTKADKLSRSAALKTLAQVQRELAALETDSRPTPSAQLFSSLKKSGLEEAERLLAQWLARPAATHKIKAPG